MDELFADRVGRLADQPSIGRPGRVPGTRELVAHESYLVVYEVQADTVWILALVHTSRLWPPVRP
jgi:plasmid stabilization system protein ParE